MSTNCEIQNVPIIRPGTNWRQQKVSLLMRRIMTLPINFTVIYDDAEVCSDESLPVLFAIHCNIPYL
jgi:hypothetical protein